MGSPQVLDCVELLSPIAENAPCGESLRWDPIYDEIKAARRDESRDALEDSELVQANWALVLTKTSEALAHRSKDLMLGCYLAEALVHLHGFAGLRDGLHLINGLLEQYWDGLYPQVDGEDLEPRAAPIVWFTEGDRGARLPNRIRDIPLTPGGENGVGYSWSFWKSRYTQPKGETEEDAAFERRRAEAEERAKAFEDAVSTRPVAEFVNLREDIASCMAEVARLNARLDEKFGRSAPGTSALRQALEECDALVGRIVKEKGGVFEGETGGQPRGEPAGPAGDQVAVAVVGPIKSRADALRRLAEVAAFFRQTEPHSPISYLVERAAGWGNLSLEQLLDELVKDAGVRDQIGELLGLRHREE